MRVGVMTASSNSGAQCVRELAGKCSVRAIFRSEEKAAPFRALPIEIVTGVDAWNLGDVFEGCDSTVIVTPHEDFAKDAELACNMIRAARGHIIFVGSWTVRCPETLIAKRFLAPEALLKEQDKWTSLRSGYFCGNYAMPHPDLTIPPLDPRDLGRVAAAIALDPTPHHAKYYDISGPEQLTTQDVMDKLKKKGRELKYLDKKEGPPFLLELWDSIEKDGLPCTSVVKDLCGVHTSFDTYIDDNPDFNRP